MGNVYELIAQKNTNDASLLAGVIEGEHAGDKALWIGGELAFVSGDFFNAKEHEVLKEECLKPGVSLIDGERVYLEPLSGRKRMVICGAGHVSMAIISLGKMLGFSITVIDDRPLFANNARSQGADQVICEDFNKALDEIDGDQDTYFIVVTRGHRYDTDCLRKILMKDYAYVGMMGSKRRVGFIKQALIEEGYPCEAVDAIYTPIGLKIGAETPEEIAVSIMAEIIALKNKKKRSGGFLEDMLYYLSGQSEDYKRMVLATITGRKGSAPRNIGTKMLIFPDGKTFDTIGGGCVEADVIRHARYMLKQGETCCLKQIDMREDMEAEAGMVCGGIVEVFMEVVE